MFFLYWESLVWYCQLLIFLFRPKKNGVRIIVVNSTNNAFSSVSDLYIPLKTSIALPEIEKQPQTSV